MAAALWFPYRAGPVDDVLRWAAGSLAVFRSLAGDGAPGVSLRGGTVVHRAPEPDLGWVRAVSVVRPAEAG